MIRACRVAVTAVGAGVLLGAAALPAVAQSAGPDRPDRGVVLTAIQYGSGSHGRHHDLNDEWVSIANTSDRDADLDGYTLTDRDGHTYVFHHARLRPGRDLVVHTGHGRDDWRDVYQNADRLLYNDFRGTITLSGERGRAIDSCSWDPSDHGYKDCSRH